ncbi:siderophore iron transporter mirB [Colletotrichum tabaci]|uniref:Siderophore iron transporter mirB n=1 Tax=Colletotrichum tabaci TaxID=1209068 RepID=A0AAV9TN78_9PEZI
MKPSQVPRANAWQAELKSLGDGEPESRPIDISQLPLAKILNIFGRMEGYMLAHLLCCFGLILMAVCSNVETYAAAQRVQPRTETKRTVGMGKRSRSTTGRGWGPSGGTSLEESPSQQLSTVTSVRGFRSDDGF